MNNEICNIIEAMLFANGQPLEQKKISEILQISEKECEEATYRLIKQYNEKDSGIKIIKIEQSYQMVTVTKYSEYIKQMFKKNKETPLSQAALEVLSVVAYHQPVTRNYIEKVRGVDSSRVVIALCEKDLIRECGRLELPGRPIVYSTTETFLRSFSLTNIEEFKLAVSDAG